MLTSWHSIFFILGLGVVSIKTYPIIFTQHAGRDTWIALIVASFITLVYVTYILWVCRQTKTYDIGVIYRSALGKPLGNLALALFGATIFLTLVESSAIEASAMRTNFMEETPLWFLLIWFLTVGVYAASRGYAAVLTVTLITIFLVFLSGVNLLFLTSSYKKYKYLLPIMAEGVSAPFLLATIKLLGAYGAVAIFFPYLIDIADRKKMTRGIIIGLLLLFQMQVVSMTGTLTTFDIERHNVMWFPKLLQTQAIRQYPFLESGELFVMFQVIAGWLTKFIISLFALLKTLEMIGLPTKHLVYLFGLITFFLSTLLTGDLFFLFSLLNDFIYISLINFMAIPFFVFSLFLLKGGEKGVRHGDRQSRSTQKWMRSGVTLRRR
ncbi:endospore germination permease [Heliobacterium gestii]|uniref:Endospore germination permease n=1 Tax=Heliomicrobium gestii TaxID=2699 RepID=A0A845LER0_HELGE|nr:endospore germination permease [Heliomicrobium gestii]MBM7865777.1 spore germination protein (amino acid permease) [Heliomicrobium gestii]MZP42023.1 endospore germination permease [Heliomicrobium gestii]